ncbi:MAG: hypothetical protein IJS08_07030, partial [Victivallales bacterium]|nr:hypothetical protein [Victivallales bacterium]
MRTRLLPVILAVFVCVIHSVHSEVSFSWVGLITSNPQDGIVACGSPIQMTIDDDFIVYGLETNEFLADVGEPTYQWYLNGSDTPCKTGQTVTFTTGDSGADVQAGDFTVSVSGSRTYTIGWPEEQLVEGCSCGCEDPFCECAFGHPIAGAKVNARGCKCCNEKTGTGEESKDAKRQGNDRLIIIPFYHYEGLDAIIANLAERAFLAAQVVITRQGETNVGNPIPIVKVGEGVELNASFKNSAVYPDFFDWTLSGVYFKDFIESAVSTPLV